VSWERMEWTPWGCARASHVHTWGSRDRSWMGVACGRCDVTASDGECRDWVEWSCSYASHKLGRPGAVEVFRSEAKSCRAAASLHRFIHKKKKKKQKKEKSSSRGIAVRTLCLFSRRVNEACQLDQCH
jgi:hypothetical protein